MSLTLHYDFASDKSLAARKGPTLSITRATNGTYRDSNGIIQTAGSGVARFGHDSSGTSLGLLVEEARTNLALYNTDTSNAAWVASNVTKGSTSVTAPDGASSTTVRLTASAGNGTLLQSVTSASATRAYSVYMKRVTGTGDIDLTVDGGSTWTTKTLTSEWQRFDITQAAVTNPQFGVRIVTSGDAIDFWGSQLETGAFPTSLIYPTTTASVTRNQDEITSSDVTWFNALAGTLYIKYSTYTYDTGSENNLISIDNGSTTYMQLSSEDTTSRTGQPELSVRQGGSIDEVDGGTNDCPNNGSTYRFAGGWQGGGTLNLAAEGVLYTQVDADDTADLSAVDTLHLFAGVAGNVENNGHIAEIAYWDERLIDATLAGLSDGSITIASTASSDDLQTRRRSIIKRRRANAALARPRKELWAGRPVNNPKYR